MREQPEDTQQLITSAVPSLSCPSADMVESGRGGGGSGSASSSSRASSTPGQRSHGREEGELRLSCHGQGDGFWNRYFSLPLLLLIGVTAMLLILPLVLPPLPPPPSMLMLVPVAMLVLLLVLAFMPTSDGRSGTGPTPTNL